jgi:flavorubredoxin
VSGTRIDEIADRVYRVSTFVPDAGLCFNQFLVDDEQPLLFHTGHRALFPAVVDAVSSVIRPEQLRWITFGHLEADECGAMNQWLAAAPEAQVAASPLANMVSLQDLCDRPPHPWEGGQVLDLGEKRVRSIDTPHVPHGWDAHVVYEETSGMLLCGDLFTALGASAPSTDADVVGPALAAEDAFGATCLTPATGATIRGLAALAPTSLALMHGPVFTGDCSAALHALADDYDRRLAALLAAA